MAYVWSRKAFSLWRRKGYGVLRLFLIALAISVLHAASIAAVESGSATEAPVSYTHLTLPTNREV